MIISNLSKKRDYRKLKLRRISRHRMKNIRYLGKTGIRLVKIWLLMKILKIQRAEQIYLILLIEKKS